MTSLQTTQVVECAYIASKVMQIFYQVTGSHSMTRTLTEILLSITPTFINRHVRTLRLFLYMTCAGFSGNHYTNIPKRYLNL